MILCVKLGALNGSLMPPGNMVVDDIVSLCRTLSDMEDKAITSALAPVISSLDKEIIELEGSRDDIEYQINEIQSLNSNHKVKSTFNSLSGIDETTKRGQDAFNSPEAVLDKSSSNKIKEMRKKIKGTSSDALEKEFTKLINDSIDNMISLDSLTPSEVDRMITRVSEGLPPQ